MKWPQYTSTTQEHRGLWIAVAPGTSHKGDTMPTWRVCVHLGEEAPQPGTKCAGQQVLAQTPEAALQVGIEAVNRSLGAVPLKPQTPSK